MAKPDNYRQFKAVRENSGQFLIGWGTAAMAKVGRRVTIEDKPGVWVVTEVYDGVRTGEQLSAIRGDQRQMADVLDGDR